MKGTIRPSEARKFLALIDKAEDSCGPDPMVPLQAWLRGYLYGVLGLDAYGKPWPKSKSVENDRPLNDHLRAKDHEGVDRG